MRSMWVGVLPLVVGSCGAERSMEPAREQKAVSQDEEQWNGPMGGAAAPAAPPPPPPPMDAAEPTTAEGLASDLRGNYAESGAKAKKEDGAVGDKGGRGGEGSPPTRAWFPESFLWMPAVETDAAGRATVPVVVPDTLTTWRVLALAQSTRGGQGGALTTFRSTLPAYVEVVPPTFLYAGDSLSLPVQVVNQEAGDLRASLQVDVTGGTGAAGGALVVPGYGSAERTVAVTAGAPGSLHVRADLAGIDAVERTIPIRPVGRPVEQAFGGTLAGPRTIPVDGVPGGRYGSVDVLVFPGALSVVDRELSLAAGRGDDVYASAYTWAIAQSGRALVGEGAHTDEEVRTLALTALQRLTRQTRNPDPTTAAVVLAGLSGADPESLEGRLAARLHDQVAAAQQPDGLWAVAPGATLDVSLVATARSTWALGGERGAAIRAAGAVERFEERLKDPVVSAWVLASGIAEPGVAAAAKEAVLGGIVTAPDGSKSLRGNRTVSAGEATAVAILALSGKGASAEDLALRADLAAGLLARWSPGRGFGPGWANLVALRALGEAMGGEIPSAVTVTLTVDGAAVGTASLDPAQPHRPITLRAPGFDGPGSHTLTLASEPAVPGLAFSLTSRTYVPWTQVAPEGLDLVVTAPQGRVGVSDTVAITAAGPAGSLVDIDVGLPAGVAVDRAALGQALSLRPVASWRAEDGAVHLTGVRLDGGTFALGIPVVPTLAGSLTSAPSSVRMVDGAGELVRVPTVWTVR